MSFQTQAGKLNSHSGPRGTNALERYITVSCNIYFLSKKGKETMFDDELPKNEQTQPGNSGNKTTDTGKRVN